MEEFSGKPNTNEEESGKKGVLTFEEFKGLVSENKQSYSIFNFTSLFQKEGMIPQFKRSLPFFIKFQQENQALEESLTERFSELSKSKFYEIPEDSLSDLYKAYKIMLSYDEVDSSEDLFK